MTQEDRITEMLVRNLYSNGFERRKFDYDEFFKSRRYTEHERLNIGAMTVTDMAEKVKYLDYSVWPYTQWELAREYLKWIFASQAGRRTRRIGFNTRTWKLLDVSQPLFWDGVVEGELAYVDIHHAYYQLYSPASLDLFFDPWEMAFGLGEIGFLEHEWLAEQRTIRNALVGICRSREHDEFRADWKGMPYMEADGITRNHHGPAWRKMRSYNKFLAPELWGYLAWNLHHVMAQIEQHFDLYYAHTDGVIVPASQARKVVDWMAESWALDARIKAIGNGQTTGIGRWMIEGQGTSERGEGQPVKNLMKPDPDMASKLYRWRRWLTG